MSCMSSEHRQQIRGHVNRAHTLRFAVARQIFISSNRNSHLFKAVVPGLDIKIVGGRKPILGRYSSQESDSTELPGDQRRGREVVEAIKR